MDVNKIIELGRAFLKPDWNEWRRLKSDQAKGIPAPEMQKPYSINSKSINLVPIDNITCGEKPFVDVISKRKSRRKFNKVSVSIEELSYMLWATQGVREANEKYTLRTVPSGGARHCFETYLYIKRVEGIGQGLYRYLPLENKLILVSSEQSLDAQLNDAMSSYDCAITFIWTAIPYRMEWRYSIVSHKMIAIDVGHVCQNLYLAAESVGCGCCAIGAYDQNKMDTFVNADGQEEFTVYAATVGRYDR